MDLSSLRFLVVEDHEVQRRLLIQILTNLGAVDVQQAADGHAALRILREAARPLHILVTDLSMPGMDGIELIRHVAEDGSGIAVILTSALEPRLLASVANMAQAYDVKLLGLVKKPPSAVKLAPLIQHYLDDRAGPGPASAPKFADIAEAFASDAFEPLFEPTVSLSTLEVKGLQAVPAWRHPVRGLLPAAAFLPAVKSCGMGEEFAWAVLRKCAAQAAAWRRSGLNLKVAVSLGLDSLADLQLAGRIEKAVRGEGAEPAQLMLGIGEGAVDAASARALETMIRLRLLGFELAVDEFGTGSMAAEQLARVAFDALKIRRDFVSAGAKGRPGWGGLVAALDIARQLRLVPVADGIATPDDWNRLQELQCELGQGPLISPPLAAAAVVPWLQAWPPRAQRGVWTPSPMA